MADEQNATQIQKGKKYAFQFPEGVSIEEQKAYLSKVQEAFEKDDIVTIDSKIKVFDIPIEEKIQVKIEDKKVIVEEPKKEEVKTEEVKTEEAVDEETLAAVKKVEEEVKISEEKIEEISEDKNVEPGN